MSKRTQDCRSGAGETSRPPYGLPRVSTLRQLFAGPPSWTLAVAESLTSGRVQARCTAHSGASDFFRGGITAYTLESKVQQLGVERRLAETTHCVSALVAEQMALGACRLFRTDIGLATTGWAEPAPECGVEIPFAWWALVHHRSAREIYVESSRIEVPHVGRVDVQCQVADTVVERLINYLQSVRS